MLRYLDCVGLTFIGLFLSHDLSAQFGKIVKVNPTHVHDSLDNCTRCGKNYTPKLRELARGGMELLPQLCRIALSQSLSLSHLEEVD